MHRMRSLTAVLGGMALSMSASADIIYSGSMSLEVSTLEKDLARNITIGEHMWEFGFVIGGPLDDSFIRARNDDTGLFSTGTINFSTTARRFDTGDTIGGLTTGLEMYPIGPGGSENENLTLHDYTTDVDAHVDLGAAAADLHGDEPARAVEGAGADGAHATVVTDHAEVDGRGLTGRNADDQSRGHGKASEHGSGSFGGCHLFDSPE